MANLVIRPIDHLVAEFWKTIGEVVIPDDPKTIQYLKRLQTAAGKLGFDLYDETLRQLECLSE